MMKTSLGNELVTGVYCVANSEGSGETARMYMLAWAFTAANVISTLSHVKFKCTIQTHNYVQSSDTAIMFPFQIILEDNHI